MWECGKLSYHGAYQWLYRQEEDGIGTRDGGLRFANRKTEASAAVRFTRAENRARTFFILDKVLWKAVRNGIPGPPFIPRRKK